MSGRGRLYKGDGGRAAGPGGRGSLCPCAHVSPEVLGALAPLTPAWHPAGPPGHRTCCQCRPGCSRCFSTPRPSWGVTETGQGSAWDGDTAQPPLPHGTAPLPLWAAVPSTVPSAMAQCSGSTSPVSPLEDRPQGTHMPGCPRPCCSSKLSFNVTSPTRFQPGSPDAPPASPSTIPLPPWCHSLTPVHGPYGLLCSVAPSGLTPTPAPPYSAA